MAGAEDTSRGSTDGNDDRAGRRSAPSGMSPTERRRLAERLHDGPVQTLTAVSLRLGIAVLDAPPSARADLTEINTLVTGSIGELRALMEELLAPDRDDAHDD